MHRIMSILLSLITVTTIFAFPQNTQNSTCNEIQTQIDELLKGDGIAGMSVSIIKDYLIKCQLSFGWADIENKIPITCDTPFMLASVSKTITGTALMLLVEHNKIGLEDNINDYLPFTITNPWYPEEVITVRMLLNHTSTLNDDFEYISPLYSDADVFEPSLVELVKGFFTKDGKYYNKTNFTQKQPGDSHNYSNMNYVVIASLIEEITKMTFNEYCNKNIFKPLEMNSTRWYVSELNKDQIAYNYEIDTSDVNKLRKIEHFGWAGYPDGGLRSSISDYCNFVTMLLKGGDFNGKQILASQTIEKIFTHQNLSEIDTSPNALNMVDMGLTWKLVKINNDVFGFNDDNQYFTHTGGGSGINTLVLLDFKRKAALITFLTGEVKSINTYLAIFKILFEEFLR